jgi:hypothetical protein
MVLSAVIPAHAFLWFKFSIGISSYGTDEICLIKHLNTLHIFRVYMQRLLGYTESITRSRNKVQRVAIKNDETLQYDAGGAFVLKSNLAREPKTSIFHKRKRNCTALMMKTSVRAIYKRMRILFRNIRGFALPRLMIHAESLTTSFNFHHPFQSNRS